MNNPGFLERSWVFRSLESEPQFVLSGLRREMQNIYPLPTSALPTVSLSGLPVRGLGRSELTAQASGMACSSCILDSAVLTKSLNCSKKTWITYQA